MALRRWVIAASLGAGLWAGGAAACPACAGRDNEHPNRNRYFLGAMILLPWTVSAAVIFALRKLNTPDSDSESSHHGDQP
ncbi:MAG TPA: hypothetical protein VND93_05355 [Myxococcales bacterium]|jgi:hypothetical protein|nr:hypothetical protein [Myxococcales bacterium]